MAGRTDKDSVEGSGAGGGAEQVGRQRGAVNSRARRLVKQARAFITPHVHPRASKINQNRSALCSSNLGLIRMLGL